MYICLHPKNENFDISFNAYTYLRLLNPNKASTKPIRQKRSSSLKCEFKPETLCVYSFKGAESE